MPWSRSAVPGDESYEKFDFYAKLGVREVWVIDRDTKRPRFTSSSAASYQLRETDRDGWVRSDVANVELRAAADDKLEIR